LNPTNRNALLLLFVAHGISGFAQGISMLSIPWYFAQKHLTGEFNGYYAFVTFLTFFWSIGAGTIVDRFSRKQVFLINNSIEMLVLGGVALIGLCMHQLSDLLVILVFFTTICGYHIHYPNLYAFAQEVTPSQEYTKINSYLEVVGQTTNIISGFFGAILLEGFDGNVSFWDFNFTLFVIPRWQIWEIFAMDALTYLIAIALIIQIRTVAIKPKKIERGLFWKRVRSGFEFLKAHPIIFKFGLFSYSIFIVMLINIHALVPAYIKNHLLLGGMAFAFGKIATALGALLSGVGSRQIFRGFDEVKIVIIFCVLSGIVFFLASTTQEIEIFLLVSFLFGFANSGARIYRLSWLFSHVPNYIIGRTNSIFSIANIILRIILISIFASEFINTDSNIVYAYALTGLIMFGSGLFLLRDYQKYQNLPKPKA